MPTQQVKLYPSATYDLSFGGEATVSWDGSGPIAGIVDDPAGAPDGQYGRFAAAFAAARTAYAEYKAGAFPLGVSAVSRIRMYARVIANGTGGTFDVVFTGYVRPAGEGQGSSGAYFDAAPVTITSETALGEVWHDILIGDWTVDPQTTVAWVPSVVRNMSWGIRGAAPATDPVVNGACLLDYVYLVMDYTSIAADIDNVRTVGSALLRLYRREPMLVEATLPFLAADAALLEEIRLEHDLGPAPPSFPRWAADAWRRGHLAVIEKTPDILAGTCRIKALNLRPYLTRWWSTFLTDIGHSIDGQGIPLMHSGGGGITVARAQVGYVERSGAPPDGLIQAAGENLAKYDRRGLAVEGAGATNTVLNSTFSQGSGDSFDDWTNSTTSTGTITQSLTTYQFDEENLRRSVLLQPGASSGEAHIQQTVSVTGAFRLRVRTNNSVGVDQLSCIIFRASDGWTWNEATEAFESTTVPNPIGLNAGGWRDWQSKLIDPGGADDITIVVGYFGAGAEDYAAFVSCVELYEGAAFIGTDLPVTDTPVARVEDVVTIQNDEVPGRAWDPAFGSGSLGIVTMWDGDDLAECEEKVFLTALHKEGFRDQILFRRAGGECFGPNAIIFRRIDEEAAVPFTPTKGELFKISWRWVAEGGELGLTSWGFQVRVNDGDWSAVATFSGPMEINPTATIYVGSDGDTSWADAFLQHLELSPLVLFDEELERLPPEV